MGCSRAECGVRCEGNGGRTELRSVCVAPCPVLPFSSRYLGIQGHASVGEGGPVRTSHACVSCRALGTERGGALGISAPSLNPKPSAHMVPTPNPTNIPIPRTPTYVRTHTHTHTPGRFCTRWTGCSSLSSRSTATRRLWASRLACSVYGQSVRTSPSGNSLVCCPWVLHRTCVRVDTCELCVYVHARLDTCVHVMCVCIYVKVRVRQVQDSGDVQALAHECFGWPCRCISCTPTPTHPHTQVWSR